MKNSDGPTKVLLLLSEQAVHDDNDEEISQDDIAHSPSSEQPQPVQLAQTDVV
jgi:hypothetical protein